MHLSILYTDADPRGERATVRRTTDHAARDCALRALPPTTVSTSLPARWGVRARCGAPTRARERSRGREGGRKVWRDGESARTDARARAPRAYAPRGRPRARARGRAHTRNARARLPACAPLHLRPRVHAPSSARRAPALARVRRRAAPPPPTPPHRPPGGVDRRARGERERERGNRGAQPANHFVLLFNPRARIASHIKPKGLCIARTVFFWLGAMHPDANAVHFDGSVLRCDGNVNAMRFDTDAKISFQICRRLF